MYEAKMAEAQRIVDAHNVALPEGSEAKIDWTAVSGKIKTMGGTSVENLRSMTWEDLQECGLPKLLARRIANEIFRQKEEAPKKPGLSIPLTETRVAAMSGRALLEVFDPTGETNPAVTKRLAELSFGKPFVVYVDGKVDVNVSDTLLRELRRGEPARDQYTIPGTSKVVQPRKAVWVLRSHQDENPLFPKTALREDETCPYSGRSYKGVPLRVRQVLYLALQTKELDCSNPKEAHDILDRIDGRTPEKMLEFVTTRYPKAVLLLQELEDKGQTLPLRITPKEDSSTDRKENPFGKHFQS